MPEQRFLKGTIKILEPTCNLYLQPIQWSCTLPDGREAVIHYGMDGLTLWDIGSILNPDVEKTTQFNGCDFVTIEQVTNWLESLFYDVEKTKQN